MGYLWQDLQYGFRVLRKSPGFSLIAVLALALGIGANSAIFSFVNGILLRPLPFEDPDRLLIIRERSRVLEGMSVAYPNFLDWRDQNQSFEQIAAVRNAGYNLTYESNAERVQAAQVSAGLWPALGARPALGRAFSGDEDRVGGNRVVVLSHALWQRLFAGDPAVLDRNLTLNGQPFTIIGVMPPSFQFPNRAELWVPIGIFSERMMERGNHPGIFSIAKLKPGVSVEQAQMDMDAVAVRLEEQYPQTNTGNRVSITPMFQQIVGPVQSYLWFLLGAVGFVLLIACANVANLLLARAATRQKEIALRTALGAPRGRIVRQLLTESALLALLGGALGLALAYGGMRALVAISPATTPRLSEVGIDPWVVAFNFAVALATGIIFGLVPALQASRTDLSETLKEGGRTSAGSARHRLRSLLVIAEMAIALVLLIGAGLIIRSFMRVLEVKPGFDPSGVLAAQVSPPDVSYPKPEDRAIFYRRVLEQLSSAPGVEAAAAVTPLPMSGDGWQTSYTVEGEPPPAAGEAPLTDFAMISPDYFRALGIQLIEGRFFDSRDIKGAAEVAIVDESFARRHFPDQSAIGKRVKNGGPNSTQPFREIVGVVGHVKNYGLAEESRVEMYVPFEQNTTTYANIVVRTSNDMAVAAAAIQSAVRSVDREIPVHSVRTMEQLLSDSVAGRRLFMTLLSFFAAVALLLAAVGIYGVMSYSVTQRRHEIGIRMALGATSADVLKLVIRQGMKLAVAGVVLGLAGTFALTKLLASAVSGLLYEVGASDPVTFGAISLILSAVAFAACYVPARKATRTDPIIALRYE
jgi:putative ABC transport system permease protein